MPDYISHSWVEVNIDGRWRRIDSFINDIDLHNAAVMELEKRNWTVGFSRALSNGSANAYLNIDNESFSQMAAVKDDHGTWEEPADYYASHHYRNRPGFLKLMFYRIAIGRINKRVERVRKEYRNIHSNQIKNN